MRRRGRLLTRSLLVVAAGLLGACAGSEDTSRTPTPVLPARMVDAGDVEVNITPTRLDATGATFAVSFDTHSVELSLDPAASATLDVDGTTWPVDRWTGAGPGGHHREGELHFSAAGPASGTAHLTISGLPKPVEATWALSQG